MSVVTNPLVFVAAVEEAPTIIENGALTSIWQQ